MELSDEQEELLKQRQKGVLPEIELPGQVYVVDWKERVLRPKDRLDLMPLKFGEKGKGFYAEGYHFLYDTEKKEFVEIDDFKLRSNIVIIKLPGGLVLDPVGVARESGLNERLFIASNPIIPKLSAEVLRVSKNEIRRMINNKIWKVPLITRVARKFKKGRGK